MDLFVTTSFRGKRELEARAQVVAARVGAPFVRREKQSLEHLRESTGRSLAYCVSFQREDVRSPTERVSIEENLMFLKLAAGPGHPFIRAVLGPDAHVDRVFDATMGLGQDALQLARVLSCHVTGVEASPAIYSLLEEGLGRLRVRGVWVREAVPRISARFGESARILAELPEGSFDVVCFDPMFEPQRGERARPGVPGYSLFRSLASRPPPAPVLEAALRVARRRVVMKLPSGAEAPRSIPWTRREEGKAISYVVADRD